MVASDYATLGSIPLSSPITHDDWVLTAWNDFILNAAGLAAIVKGGITKLGTRNPEYDVAGVAPSWAVYASAVIASRSAEDFSGHKPKLVVTYQ